MARVFVRWRDVAQPMKRVVRPGVLIPLTISVALFAALLSVGNLRDILRAIARFDRAQLWGYLLLLLVYEAARAAQWLFLLSRLRVRVPVRAKLVSFLGGEVAKSLPLGNYFPNYLLHQTGGADFGLTSAASSAIILFEIVVSFAGVVILGLGAWTTWARLVILGVSIGVCVVGWVLYRMRGAAKMPQPLLRFAAVRRLLDEWHRFQTGMVQLARPSTLAVGLVLCSTYLLAGAGQLYVIAHAVGLDGLTLSQAMAVYCATLAITLTAPSPVDLGIMEASGAGALVLVGVSRDPAIAVMLISRVLSVGLTLVIATVGALVLHREAGALLRRPLRAPAQADETGSAPAEESVVRAG